MKQVSNEFYISKKVSNFVTQTTNFQEKNQNQQNQSKRKA